MRRLVSSLLAIMGIAVVAAAAEANASNITWFLSNVTPFASGQTASGFFTVDQESGKVVDWNITVTGGSKPALTNLKFVTNMIGCVAFCVSGINFIPEGSGTTIQFRTPLASDNTIEDFTLGILAMPNEIIFPSSPQLAVGNRGQVITSIIKELFIPNILSLIDRDGLLGTNATLVTFAGAPGKPNCYGQSVSTLAREFGGLNGAAAALGFPSVQALQSAISRFCGGRIQSGR